MIPMNSEPRRPITERMLDRATRGIQEIPGQFRRTFANIRYSNPALYEQKRAEQRAALADWKGQRPVATPPTPAAASVAQTPNVGQAAATLAQRLAQRKMRQMGGPRPAGASMARPAVMPQVPGASIPAGFNPFA